jgi:hypothetical protein
VRFNTVAYNNGSQGSKNGIGGVFCDGGTIDASDDLVIGNEKTGNGYNDIGGNDNCMTEHPGKTDQTVTTSALNSGGGGGGGGGEFAGFGGPSPPNPANAKLVSTTDLHLTSSSPNEQILDDFFSDCSSYPVDIDGQARPKVQCDIGADECYPDFGSCTDYPGSSN